MRVQTRVCTPQPGQATRMKNKQIATLVVVSLLSVSVFACGDSASGTRTESLSCQTAAKNICGVCEEYSSSRGFSQAECIEGTVNQCESEGWSEARRDCVSSFSDTGMCGAPVCASVSESDSGMVAREDAQVPLGSDFDCDGTSCDGRTHICITSRVGAQTEPQASVCADKTDNCNDCGCDNLFVNAAWQRETNRSNNCSNALVTCESNNGNTTFECYRQKP